MYSLSFGAEKMFRTAQTTSESSSRVSVTVGWFPAIPQSLPQEAQSPAQAADCVNF